MNFIGQVVKAMVLSGLAAFLACVVNQRVVDCYGEKAVGLFVPFVEEGLKTGIAVIFDGPITLVHVLFGVYEAGYDFAANPGMVLGKRGIAALCAFAGHGLFGLMTLLMINKGLQPLLGVGIVGLAHSLWNTFVLHRA